MLKLEDTHLGQNRSGFWEVRWTERQADGTWRTRSASCRTKDRSKAERFRQEFVRDLNGVVREQSAPTVEDITAGYLAAAEGRRVGPTQEFSLRHIRRAFGPDTLAAITAPRLQDYRVSRNVKDGTLRRELGALIAACRWAARHKLIDPASIPAVDLPPVSAGREMFLDEDQEREFLALAYGDSIGKRRLTRITRFVALALDTAARKAAIEGLTWDRVDLVAGVIDFRQPGRKVSKKRRVPVPIADRLYPLLGRAWLERTSDWVCDPGSIRSAWDTWLARTPFATMGLTIHDMRRTWATLAARRGVELWDIAGVLGDDPATVEAHYAHHRPDHLRRAINRTL